MNVSSFLIRAARGAPALGKISRTLALAVVAVATVRAGYTGPVPAPADAFGGPGTYAVAIETFPSPDWPGQVVTVYRPEGATGRRPTWFFAHGFGGTNPAFYDELLSHLASHGAVVVFSPYPADLFRVADNHTILDAGFVAAAERFPESIDTARVGFAGHSYGGGAVPALALRAVRERGWGGGGLALLMLAPWHSYFVSDADLASFPAGTQAVVQVYEDDGMNDHRMAIDIFTHLNVPAADKDFLMLRSDRIDGYNYDASHRVPTGAKTPGGGAFDALDAWGVLRIAEALGASAWEGDPAARAVALGNGSAEQVAMGVAPGGRALRPMAQSDTPVALFPSSRYLQPFDGLLNPRSGATLPAPARRPHLGNLSARARPGVGDEVLIAGAVVAGARPKSLLVRAVGPGLAEFGVAGAMPDPRLVTFRGSTTDLDLDDWGGTPDAVALVAATFETGAFELAEGSRDAALLASFPPGTLTAHAVPADGAAGIALLELYDADDDDASVLTNLSARARVGVGDDMLIAGFVVTGEDGLRLLIRGIGPGLGAFGLGGTLPDPRLELHRGDERIAANDDWSTDPAQAAEIATAAAQVSAFALAPGSADACLLLTLLPGAYTAQVSVGDGREGLGMVEVYAVP